MSENDNENPLQSAFQRTVAEGELRLHRTWPGLLATGAVGGVDVGMGVFALLLVKEATHSDIAAALAFSIGFIAITLANSELFTENFLVPVATLAAGHCTFYELIRLWVGTLVMNLAGGWVLMAFVIGGFEKLRPVAIEVATHYTQQGIGWTSFATAVLGGTVITLMTWMQQSTESVPAKLVAAIAAAFLLAAGSLNHAIVVSIEMFAALHAGAPFGYLDWLGMLGWACLGNLVGGIGLVTVLRLVQVGGDVVTETGERLRKEQSVRRRSRRRSAK
jgi:formate/nitrite transporter FocA (FNT family)